MNTLQLIKSFVEGSCEPSEFFEKLTTQKEIENFLSSETDIPSYASEGNDYLYLIGLDFSDFGDISSAQEILSFILKQKNIEHRVDEKYAKIYKALLKTEPKWINIKINHYKELILEYQTNGTKGIEKYIKNNITPNYKYINNPPHWLQSPNWPLSNGTPLVFVGQIDISKINHDTAQLYIFFDAKENVFKSIKQTK